MQPSQASSNRYDYEVFADYHQITLEDCAGGMPRGDGTAQRAEEIADAVALLLDPPAFARHLGVYPGVLCILTARNMDVPLTVEVYDTAPQDDLTDWDHVVEASLDVPSGCIRVSGGDGMFEASPEIRLAAGVYRARVYFGGIYTISNDGLDGSDHYRVVLWPGAPADPVVLHTAGSGGW